MLVDVGVLSTACCALASSAFASRVNSNNAVAVRAVRKYNVNLELMYGGGGGVNSIFGMLLLHSLRLKA